MLDGPRAATPNEIPEVVRLSNSVFYPDGRIRMERVLPALFAESNVGAIRVIRDAGRLVAMAGMVISDLRLREVTVRAACIGSVCTTADYRGRGLAGLLMEDVFSHAASRGALVALISGGRGLYRRMGCIDAGLFTVIELVPTHQERASAITVRPWSEQDLPVLWELHEKEPVRFVRSRADMDRLVGARATFCRPVRTWIAETRGRPAAYLCVSGPDDRTGPGVTLVREIAGDRTVVLAAAAAIQEAESAERMQIEVPASDALASLAARKGHSCRPAGMHGTLKVIDITAFRAALAPLFPEDAPVLPEDPADLAAAVFGSVERSAAVPDGARAGSLPLPLPGYGLSYI